MSLQPYYISGYNNGLINNKKPFLIPDQAFQQLENAYCWRDRIIKRQGNKLVGRLARTFTLEPLANADGTGTYDNGGVDLYTTLVIPVVTTEPNAEIQPKSVVLTVDFGNPTETKFTDNGSGQFTRTSGITYQITSSSINYITSVFSLTWDAGGTPAAGITVDVTLNYFPSLPVMGICERELAGINDEQTIYFDTKYAYGYSGGVFTELFPGTVWTGSDADFFWSTNYRGNTAYDRLFFVTNFNLDKTAATYDPIYYNDGTGWTSFQPIVADNPPSAAQNIIYQARIIVPYWGRLLMLNTWEGETGIFTYQNSNNYFNRCRFSQLGNPLATDAWRSDQFGKGGLLDAPVSEEITSAIFYKNTLIVFFEQTTWQLRYIGEYGTPFIWERISSDYGSESTFSPILFDEGVLAIGDKAIISSNSINVQRIDFDIPDRVYQIQNSNDGPKRVCGIRDFQKELVYWAVPISNESAKFPNKTLVYNYRNNTWAYLRNNVTAFGTQQTTEQNVITWDRLDIFWDNDAITWNDPLGNILTPRIVCGNQQGYVHFFAFTQFDDPSLSISAIDLTTTPIELTVINHNLGENLDLDDTVDEIVYLEGLNFDDGMETPLSTDLNNKIYQVRRKDVDTLELRKYNEQTNGYDNSFSFTPVNTATYLGGGKLRILPRMSIQTKDFNPFQAEGSQVFTSYLDLLTDVNQKSEITVEIYANTKQDQAENIELGNIYIEQSQSIFGYISNITQSTTATITSINHGLLDGQNIVIQDVLGMVEINAISSQTITVVDSNTFTIPVDSTGFTAYSSGGTWYVTTPQYYEIGSQYQWHRFYATATGQYLNFKLTYDDFLMNQVQTHRTALILNAMAPYFRRAGKNIF